MLQEGYRSTLQIKLDHWLFHNDFNENTLEIFGKIYVIFSLFIYGTGEMFGNSFVKLAQAPDIFFNPPLSIAQFFSGFPNLISAWGLDIILHVLFGMAFFSLRPTVIYFLIFLLLYTANSFGFSFGKINHNFVSLILPLILSLGHLLSWKSPPHIGFTKALYAFLIGFAFFTAGLPKLFAGDWVNIWEHAVRGYVANFFVFSNPLSQNLGLNQALLGMNGKIWELMDFFTIGFELLFLFAAFSHKSFRYFLLLASLFHLGTYFLMNIGFFHHFLCFMLFLPWQNSNLLTNTASKLNRIKQPLKLIFALLFSLLAFIPNSLFYFLQGIENPLINQLSFATLCLGFVCIFAWNLKPDLKEDFNRLKKELLGLWFAKS